MGRGRPLGAAINEIIVEKNDNCMVHKIFPKTFPKNVSYILLKCLYASHSPGGVPKTAIKFHILHLFLLQLTYTGFSTKYLFCNNVSYASLILNDTIVNVK